MTQLHRFPVTVYYEDTDLGAIVYHANYLKFIERARSDWVRGLGIDQNALRERGIVFAVHRIEADFLSPAKLDDQLEVRTSAGRASGVRMGLHQEVWRGETCLFRATVTLVCMNAAGKPQRLPPELINFAKSIGGKP